MSTAIAQLNRVQDRVIETLEGVKEPVTGAVERVVELVTERLPEFSGIAVLEKLPTSRELVDNGFEFAGRLQDTTKEIVISLVDAASPLGDKLRHGTVAAAKPAAKPAAAKPAARTTKKAAAKKSPAA